MLTHAVDEDARAQKIVAKENGEEGKEGGK
jgi:hypothetical protein